MAGRRATAKWTIDNERWTVIEQAFQPVQKKVADKFVQTGDEHKHPDYKSFRLYLERMAFPLAFLFAGLETFLCLWGSWQVWRARLERKITLLLLLLFNFALVGRILLVAVGIHGQRMAVGLGETYLAFGIAIGLWLLLRAQRNQTLTRSLLLVIPWLFLVAGLAIFQARFPEVIWRRGIYLLPRQALPALGAFLGWLFLAMGMVIFALRQARQIHQPMHRARFAYWAIILLLFALDGLNTFVWSLPNIHPWRSGMIWTLVYLFTHHRVRPLRKVLRTGLIYLSTFLLLVLLYILSSLASERLFGQRAGYDPRWSGGVIALGLALLFTPLLNQIEKQINRWLRIQTPDISRIVQLYSQNISTILEMQRLAQVAVALIMETAGLAHGFFFLVERTEEKERTSFRLRAVRYPGERQIRQLELREDHPIVAFFLSRAQPLLQYDLDLLPEFRSLSPLESEWFGALRAEVYVPVFSRGNWIGLFAFGPRLNQQPFSEEDLALLSSLAQQTAIAIENARLVEDLVRLNRELRQTASALEKAQREVERLDRTRADFISIASHELRTPLTVIRGYVEMLLEKEDLDPEIRTFLKGVHESTLRMYNIVESMFAITQLTHQLSPIQSESVDVGALVQEAALQLTSRLAQRSLTLSIEIPPLPFIYGDRTLLSKVFFQLLENGIKFTPDGGRLHVRGQLQRPSQEFPQGAIELIFSDTGVGVAPSEREAIFTKFYKSGDLNRHSTSKVRFMGGGTGLGLALCKAVIEAHQGRIWVESPGYDEVHFPGSHFHVLLPLRLPGGEKTIRMASAVRQKYP
jgi:signal transduction histidine kinase